MKNKYEEQRQWSDSYIPTVSRIIINCLGLDPNVWHIKVTSFDQDTKEAADLILTDGDEEFMIALRLRNAMYMKQYPLDFTIRREYTEGYKTEFEKIMEGFADMMFYGFRDGNRVVRWVFLSMDAFRLEHHYSDIHGEWIGKPHVLYERRDNHDGRNCFHAYKITSFENPNLIIAHSPGYFEDVKTNVYEGKGVTITTHTLKPKEQRLDK